VCHDIIAVSDYVKFHCQRSRKKWKECLILDHPHKLMLTHPFIYFSLYNIPISILMWPKVIIMLNQEEISYDLFMSEHEPDRVAYFDSVGI
jgi:hypothetical protein